MHFLSLFFFFNDTATTEIYTLSLHDALPILVDIDHQHGHGRAVTQRAVHLALDLFHHVPAVVQPRQRVRKDRRSEEHTSELQSPCNLVCRLLLEKKKKKHKQNIHMNANMNLQ